MPFPAVLAIAFLLGALPFGLMVSRAFGLGDIRRIGSGNIGATNVLRTGNKLAAVVTLLLDLAKGAGAVFIPVLLVDDAGQAAMVLSGGAAVVGHCFSPFVGWKGGKGVATALGVLLSAAPLAGIGTLLLWLATALLRRKSSLAALVSLTISPVFVVIETQRITVVVPWIFIVTIIILRHEANITRLINGTEPDISLGRRPQPAPQEGPPSA